MTSFVRYGMGCETVKTRHGLREQNSHLSTFAGDFLSGAFREHGMLPPRRSPLFP
jgi:hypothetical protein